MAATETRVASTIRGENQDGRFTKVKMCVCLTAAVLNRTETRQDLLVTYFLKWFFAKRCSLAARSMFRQCSATTAFQYLKKSLLRIIMGGISDFCEKA